MLLNPVKLKNTELITDIMTIYNLYKQRQADIITEVKKLKQQQNSNKYFPSMIQLLKTGLEARQEWQEKKSVCSKPIQKG